VGGDAYDAPPKRKTQPPPAPKPLVTYPSDRAEYVLSLGEAAGKLSVTRGELMTMIAGGKIKALPTGYTRMIPTSEVERLSGG
jgi:excisionase family DNA binding protein